MLAPSPLGVPTLLHWGVGLDVSPADLAAYAGLRAPRRPALGARRAPPPLGPPRDVHRGSPAPPRSRGGGSDRDRRGPWAPRFVDWSWQTADDRAVLTSTDDEAGLEVRWEARGHRGGAGAGPRRSHQHRRGAVRRRRRCGSPCRCRRMRRSCSTSPAGGAASGRPSGTRGRRARGRAAAGTAGPATTRPCCSSPAPLASASGAASVWGVHVAWSGDHHDVRRAHAGGRVPARRRRAARPRRGRAGARGDVRRPVAGRLLLRRRARRGRPTGCTGGPGATRRAPAGPARWW